MNTNKKKQIDQTFKQIRNLCFSFVLTIMASLAQPNSAYGRGGITKNQPEQISSFKKKTTLNLVDQENIEYDFNQTEWVQKHNKQVLRERKKIERNIFLKNRECIQQKKHAREFAFTIVNFINQTEETNNRNEFSKVFNYLLKDKNKETHQAYVRYICEQAQQSKFKKISDLKNVQRLFPNQQLFESRLDPMNLEWEQLENFFMFLKVSALPIGATIGSNEIFKKLELRGGYNPIKKFLEKFKKEKTIDKDFEIHEKDKRKNFNILQILSKLSITHPVALSLALVILVYLYDREKRKRREQRKKANPFWGITTSYKEEPKTLADTVVDIFAYQVFDILTYFYYHPSQLFVLIFVIYHRKQIWALLSNSTTRESFVTESFKNLAKSRDVFIDTYHKSGKVLKKYRDKFYDNIQTFRKRNSKSLYHTTDKLSIEGETGT